MNESLPIRFIFFGYDLLILAKIDWMMGKDLCIINLIGKDLFIDW